MEQDKITCMPKELIGRENEGMGVAEEPQGSNKKNNKS